MNPCCLASSSKSASGRLPVDPQARSRSFQLDQFADLRRNQRSIFVRSWISSMVMPDLQA